MRGLRPLGPCTRLYMTLYMAIWPCIQLYMTLYMAIWPCIRVYGPPGSLYTVYGPPGSLYTARWPCAVPCTRPDGPVRYPPPVLPVCGTPSRTARVRYPISVVPGYSTTPSRTTWDRTADPSAYYPEYCLVVASRASILNQDRPDPAFTGFQIPGPGI